MSGDFAQAALSPGPGDHPAGDRGLPGQDPYHTGASGGLADERTLSLKHDDCFAVFNPSGDIDGGPGCRQGLYFGGTRHLSRLRLALNGRRPLLLGGEATRDGARVVVDLMSPDIDGPPAISSGDVHIGREARLCEGLLVQRLTASNYSLRRAEVRLTLEIDADFADVFEVRGMRRERRGTLRKPDAGPDRLAMSYTGLDGLERWTALRAEPPPAAAWAGGMEFRAALEPGARAMWHLAVAPTPEVPGPAGAFARAGEVLQRRRSEDRRGLCEIETGSELLHGWVVRSLADLRSLTTRTRYGPYPFAGIPWYCCPFGRDGIITALQTLWLNPDWARGVLCFLASTQAQGADPARAAEPGKIVHEMREGEMASLGEVPFGRYYGTVDATPLFVILAGEFLRATGDLRFARELWPAVERALGWIETSGDPDGDGFVEYPNDSPAGLRNQGWKDSHDSVFHADGAEPVGPIALCEVQAYVHGAWRHGAHLASALGMHERAADLRARAELLKARFNEAFWDDGLGAYALALDGRKRRCSVLASNAGQCLLSPIAPRERAACTARAMMGARMFSGWGIRTLAEGEARYNPMSYHNGSVWPHDNALVALGMSRYGLRRAPARLLDAWLGASALLPDARLPELVCGFDRGRHLAPVLYPVACSPQAWASGAVFMLLAACLGLTVRGQERALRIVRPTLPASVGSLALRGVRVGDGRADVVFRRHAGGVDVSVTARDRGVRVITSR